MEDHIPIRPDRSLLLGRQTSKWSFWDVVFHENNFNSKHPVSISELGSYFGEISILNMGTAGNRRTASVRLFTSK